jgi:hypothetical protein
MRKIVVGAQVCMDGVMQAPGGPQQDPTKGFTFGGWVMPDFDTVFGEEIDRVFNERFDLLLGCKTYGIFAAYWPYCRGKKLFADGSAPHSYALTRSRVSTTGLVIAHYERGSGIKIGDTALDSPSDAERSRQERMKREG